MTVFVFPTAFLQPPLIGILLGPTLMLLMPTVSAMTAVHKQMHKGAGQENQEGQKLPDVLPVLDEQKICDRADKSQCRQSFGC